MSILLTGASGFLGTAILRSLYPKEIRVLGRNKPKIGNCNYVCAEIAPGVDYSSAFEGIDVVIHSAARAHMIRDKSESPLDAYREVNTAGTLNLARQAAETGVRRFIFISSIKVNGESTASKPPYKFDAPHLPEDPYGISKSEAEIGLLYLARQTNMEVVIIRPPLVYGPGVKANFASMMKLASKNLPLPLGAIKNKRSLVCIDNLVDLIITCIDHPKAANQTFLVSDDHDVSTTELLIALTTAAGNNPRLISVPMKLIKVVATLLGKKAIADRLCGSLQVDISHTKETLGWKPPVSFEQSIARCFEKVLK
jgi:nucleoside-diphosphate-sugar epimerase